MSDSSSSRRQALWVLMILVILPLIWGYNWIVIKQVQRYIGPFEFGAWRYIAGSLCLFLILKAMKKPLLVGHWGQVALVGLFQIAINTALTIWSVRTGPAGSCAVLNYAMPVWVVLMAWPILKERPSRPQIIALSTAFPGILFLFASKGTQGNHRALILALLSGIAWAIGSVLAKHLMSKHKMDPMALTAWQMFVAGIAMAIAAWLVPGMPTQWHQPYLIFGLLWEILPATALAWFLWTLLLKKVDAGVAGLAVLGGPVVGILAGAIQLHEIPLPLQAIGMVLILVGLVFVGPLAMRQVRRAS
nr:EamA family transporter [uncultured Holophaga sp.]